MTQCLSGSRLRRAAAPTLFFGVFAVRPMQSLAEQVSDNGTPCTEPFGSSDARGTDQGECFGDSAPCFNDGYKHYYPVWIGAEWINWRLDGNRLPPLVADGPATTPIANVARFDDPGTRILSGGETVNDDWRDGFLIYGGVWLDCCRTCGVGVDYFELGGGDYTFTSENDPTRVVGRPFFNTELGVEDVQLISVPGELDGTTRVKSGDNFQGAGVTFNRRTWQCGDPCSYDVRELNLLGGYRFYEYDTNLSITENLTVLPGTQTPLVPGTTFFLQDRFRTHNEFNGGEIGLQGFSKHSYWWLDGVAKIAMGEQHRTVKIDGQTDVVVPDGGLAAAAGGLLTSEVTNIGRYDESEFVLIPECRLGIGGQLTHYCSIRAGYNVIIWSDVARAASHLPPGLQADPRNLPPAQPGGGPEPEFPGIRGSQLLAHGLDLDVMLAF